MKIVLSTALALLLLGCGEEAHKTATTHANEAKQAVEQKVQHAVTATQEKAQDAVATAKEHAQAAVATVKEQAQTAVKKVQDKAPEVAPVKTEVVDSAVATVKSAAKVDGATLYKACASCHGADASKHALNKSQVIKGWSAQKISDALHGYKNKTYGGAMKSIMQGQAGKLSDADIEALANYISKL